METTQKTVAQEAYELLKDIPAENWIVGEFTDGQCKGCIIGHYTRLKSQSPENFSYANCSDWMVDYENRALRKATQEFLWSKYRLGRDGSDVNNSPNINGYDQPEIKDRCMALLQDMIKAGY